MRSFAFTVALATLMVGGCADHSADMEATSRPSLAAVPADHATADYWFKQPSVISVSSRDFEKLWKACSDTVVNDQFEIDRQDYRLGVLTTWPLVSKQFFEFWRSDAGTVHGVAQSSLQTIRRTIRFEVTRGADGTYTAVPKVLVEQSSHPERRISSVSQYAQAFTAVYETPTRTTDEGYSIPNRYWYSLGRDEGMERELAHSIREKLGER